MNRPFKHSDHLSLGRLLLSISFVASPTKTASCSFLPSLAVSTCRNICMNRHPIVKSAIETAHTPRAHAVHVPPRSPSVPNPRTCPFRSVVAASKHRQAGLHGRV
ncbi:hypothetical protein PMIN06_012955 [Paraphaeosphaeria minitans]